MVRKSLKDEYIRFYPYEDLIGKDRIGHGAFSTVATSGITVVYKLIPSDEAEFFKDFVNKVCNCA